ncbi:unnamed protein product [Gulo gulo]|uniref:Uncharacterized protein n=1 Tax=Gulo gulo TaxID=48420 RepID=A0A9X9LW14_GULGU|nr:unnamed protein product [Gulo gulo]
MRFCHIAHGLYTLALGMPYFHRKEEFGGSAVLTYL